MHFTLQPLLSSSRVEEWRAELLAADAPWRLGAETAGWHAREVKNNRQLDRSSPLHQRLAAELGDVVLAHPLVQAAALPLRAHGLLFSRSGPGEGYGRHVDNAFMADGRSDLSFTVFLSDPGDYEGGALVLESPGGRRRCGWRLGRRSCIRAPCFTGWIRCAAGNGWWRWVGCRAAFAVPIAGSFCLSWTRPAAACFSSRARATCSICSAAVIRIC